MHNGSWRTFCASCTVARQANKNKSVSTAAYINRQPKLFTEEVITMDTNPTKTNPEEGTMKYEIIYDLGWVPVLCFTHLHELYTTDKSGITFQQWKENRKVQVVITDDLCEFCTQDKDGLNIEINTTNPKEGNKMETKPIYHIAFTGHRPNKLGGYDDNSPKRLALRQQIEETLQRAVVKYGTTHQIIVISGGALGVDQDAARVAYKINIPFIVAQPCKNHESKWVQSAQIKYRKMLELAAQVVLVSDGTYTELGAKCMQDRNIWMVNHCDALVAVWDGTSGGTANCVRYAQKVGKPIVHISPNNLGGNPTNNTERSAS
jgi:uncharacterized phage-like protein YoqJ